MKFTIVLILSLVAEYAFSQARDVKVHQSSTPGSLSRYEIVQSTLAARWTFRLDKVCGNVGLLVSSSSDGVTWEPMLVVDQPACVPDAKIRYQLFTSGLAARHTFLINTDTGKSWQIRSVKDSQGTESSAWFPFD